MKYLILLSSFLFMSGCSYVRWVTVDKNGQIINENQRPVNVVGNPQMSCYDSQNKLIAQGYFVRQTDIGDFVIDEYGKDYVVVESPNCRLGSN